MRAMNTPMQIGPSLHTIDFTGSFRQRVVKNPDDSTGKSVRLQTLGFSLRGNPPGTHGEESTSVTLEWSSQEDPKPKSLLKLTGGAAPFESLWALDLTMTVNNPDDSEPTVLSTKDPVMIQAAWAQYPSKCERFELLKPIELFDSRNPGIVGATVRKLPMVFQ